LVDDKLIVDTLTIALVRVYQKIKDDELLKERFDNFLKNMEIKLYIKPCFKGVPFFRVFVNGERIVSDRRIKIRFKQVDG